MTTETKNPKSTGGKRLSLTLLALLVGAALLGAYGLLGRPVAQASPPAEATIVPMEVAITPVEVATVQTGDIAQVFYYAGVLQAKDEVNLAPRISGRIEAAALLVRHGARADVLSGKNRTPLDLARTLEPDSLRREMLGILGKSA